MSIRLLLAALLGAPLAASAQGAPAVAACATPPAAAAAPSTARLVAPSVPGLGMPADAARLNESRGGTDSLVNDTRLTGSVSGNSATQVVTGANIIQASSFADAAGIPIVIQNTGANVLIQNATVINLRLQ